MGNAWDAAQSVVKTLKENGYRTYIVGGAVRDRLLGRDIADVDVVTEAAAQTVETMFKKTFRMNNDHDTVIVRAHGEHIEVTTMRGKTIEEDLKSRDLTINSIAYDTALIDPLGGYDDIKKRLLRSFEADARMKEDPLRMLRVYRFMSELGFHIANDLTEAIKANKQLLESVAIERIVKEWLKLMQGTNRNEALRHMVEETELYRHIPKLALTKESIAKLRHLPSLREESETFCWFMFCLCQAWERATPLKKFALANELLRAVNVRLDFYHARKTSDWNDTMLYEATLSVALDVEKARQMFQLETEAPSLLKERWDALPIKNARELAINGHDLLKDGCRPGPWIKEELKWAEYAVVTREVKNDKEALLDALERRRTSGEGGAPKNISTT